MKIPFVDLGAQYVAHEAEIDAAIKGVIINSAFIGGPYLAAFEANFAKYIGARHCLGVGNGTDALFIALKCLGIGEGHEVITAANSFIATSEAITLAGARVVFADCDEQTYTIDISKIEALITPKTKAIIPVHIYGQPADMDAIADIAGRHRLFIVEDAAQAHGAAYRGRNVGTFGQYACFSFFPGKNLGAYGDAGAVVTADDELATKARMFANHGRLQKYNHAFEGVNSRLDGLQAAILDVKLKYLNQWTERRRAIARIYDEALGDVVGIPYTRPDARHVYHLYVIRSARRDMIMSALADKGIATGIHYPIPLPFLEAYKYLGHTAGDFPVAYGLKDEIMSLPIHGDLTDEQAVYVADSVRAAIGSTQAKAD